MANAEQISVLKKKRASIKAACSKTYIESMIELSKEIIANLKERKKKLMTYRLEYDGPYCILSDLRSISDEKTKNRILFEEMYFEFTANIRCLILNSHSNNTITNMPSAAESEDNYYVQLPKLDLLYLNFRENIKTGSLFTTRSIR